MNTNCFTNFRAFWLGLVLLCGSLPLQADQFGLFTYQVVGGATVEITRYPQDAVGPVEIPAMIAGKPVASIGGGAFFGCRGLTSVTIPSSITSIGCKAFSGCTGLISVAIPSSVTSIDWYAFSGCSALTSVTIQQGLTTISAYTFFGCSRLTSVTIPEGVMSIGEWAFFGCTGLTNIEVAATNPNFSSLDGVLFNKDRSTLIQCPGGKAGAYTIPSSVTTIGDWAFYGCTGLTSIIVAPGNEHYSSEDGVLFDAAMTTLIQCPGGKPGSYTIPSSVTDIGGGAFYGCTGLTSIIVAPGNPHYSSEDGVLFDAAMTTLIQCPGGKAGAYTIPSSVTCIGAFAFSRCTGLTGVSIPSSVTSIGRGAFYGCTGLTSVTIPSSVDSITGNWALCNGDGCGTGYGAFLDCSTLTTAVFLGDAPGFTGGGVFAGADAAFTIYYLSGSTGFTSPTWEGYPATMIDEAVWPAASWLLTHNLGYDTDLHQDPDGDGVDLLMAYALDLDPRLNLQGSLPVPARNGNTLSLSFHATSPGITYRAETSPDLQNWTTTGVTQSAPGPDGQSTATVPLDSPRRFLRLTVED